MKRTVFAAQAFAAAAVLCLLSACAAAPHIEAPDNSDLAKLDSCEAVQKALERSQNTLNALNAQKKRSNAGNALTVGAAMLALNPLMLFDIRRMEALDASIRSHQARTDALTEKQRQLCPNQLIEPEPQGS